MRSRCGLAAQRGVCRCNPRVAKHQANANYLARACSHTCIAEVAILVEHHGALRSERAEHAQPTETYEEAKEEASHIRTGSAWDRSDGCVSSARSSWTWGVRFRPRTYSAQFFLLDRGPVIARVHTSTCPMRQGSMAPLSSARSLRKQPPSARGRLRSQSGPHAGAWRLTALPTAHHHDGSACHAAVAGSACNSLCH